MKFLVSIATSVLMALTLPCAMAEVFPTKPVSIVVPYAPGGPVDNLSRVLATRLGKDWGQPVLVVNKTGANEIIGAEFVAKSAPDGYTLFAALAMGLNGIATALLMPFIIGLLHRAGFL